jgi:diguanylate cyclase (GGDEF)-like protein
VKRVLVIEDDPIIRQSIQKFLEAEGIETKIATDGESGLNLIQTYAPDLVICDIMMPGINGYDVLRKIRNEPDTASIPFIFLTAKVQRSDLRHGMELGADDFVTKPFTRDELLAAVTARFRKQAVITQPYVEAMREAAENLQKLSLQDALTGLPNRIRFYHKLQESINQSKATEQLVAVLHLSVSNMGEVAEQYGQEIADELLQAIAQSLQAKLGSTDNLARLGSTEIGVICESFTRRYDVANLAQQLLGLLLKGYWLRGKWLKPQISLGIALFPDNGTYPNDLIHHAQLATHQVHKQRTSHYQFYSLEIDVQAAQRSLMIKQLPKAIENGELRLEFQPLLHLITGRILGAEALIRWHQPELGVIYPRAFLAIAKEIRYLEMIEAWVLHEACRVAQTWQSLSHLPVKVLVNLSSEQLENTNLPILVTEVLAETELDPSLLLFELQESDLMEHMDTNLEQLQVLKNLGVKTVIDNFGTGLTSLNYLQRLPLEGIKVDSSLVHGIESDKDALSVVKAVVAVAQSLHLRTIAAGVEKQEQMEHLRQSGCYAAQGNALCSPLSADGFEDYLNQKRTEIEEGKKTV